MKNLMFSLAFMLVGSFAFAASSDSTIYSQNAEFSFGSDYFSSKACSVSSQIDALSLKECRLKVKGTIDGKKIDLDITFTSDSGSCIKDTVALVKELAEEGFQAD
jgi:hypothetical protein